MYAGRYFGQSSDSDTGPEERPMLGATQTTTATTEKKKKKKLAPQQSIDKTWTRFSQDKFSKALTILPFAPVPPPASSGQANELLSAGYDRAVEECRRKVKKIIQECKRVNMRYRDSGFDLDWDLKTRKGHCLNSLVKQQFVMTKSSLQNPRASVPKAVKRVHEIFENPTFMANISGSDAKQGTLGDCWLIASLSSLASVEGAIQRMCVEYDIKIGIYGFVFYRDGEWIYSIVDDKLFLTSPCWDSPSLQREMLQQIDREDEERVYRKTYQTGSKALFFAQNLEQNETWMPLIEKAYAKAHGDYASLIGGWVGEGLEDLSGGVTTELLASDILDTESFWDNELSRVNQEFLFGCSTGLLDGGYGNRNGIREGHAYNVVEARTLKDGTRLVKLRNPWGKVKVGTWHGAWSDGSKEWTKEMQEELGHTFGCDSVFWITYQDLLRKYLHFDRTRLFRDADWRCCQRWVGVQVPWKAEFNEKFHVKLTKDSPLVLVMSQLDGRYFKGLQGQYTFCLHFRVHEQGRPEAEDYIVRSHGNYLMARSVSVELPSMPAGNYSIFVSVVGDRWSHWPSVEDVVKRECKSKVENEKLAQVGRAYDLAHSKAAAHVEELAKIRKKADQNKASESRKMERRKAWVTRHLMKEVQKKQAERDTEKKRQRKAAKLEALKKKLAEEEVDRLKREAAEEEARKVKAAAEAVERKKKEAAEEEEQKKKEAAEEEERKKKEAADEEERKKKEAADEEERKRVAAAEEEARKKEENKPKDRAIQTDPSIEEPEGDEKADKPESEDKADQANTTTDMPESENKEIEADTTPDEDKADACSTSTSPSSTPQHTPLDTPTLEAATAGGPQEKVPLPPVHEEKLEVSGGPPPDEPEPPSAPSQADTAPSNEPKSPPPEPQVSDVEDSSDSPIDDWEELYSSDDLSKKPHVIPREKPVEPSDDDSEDENAPLPWNAICIVGFRVYSKDEDLELRVVVEGGDLSEGGMGEKGEQDLDNAQANAGGARDKKAEEEVDERKEEDEKAEDADEETDKDQEKCEPDNKDTAGDNKGEKDGGCPYPTIIQKGGEEYEKASAPVGNDEKKAEELERGSEKPDQDSVKRDESSEKEDPEKQAVDPSADSEASKGEASKHDTTDSKDGSKSKGVIAESDNTMNWG